MNIHLLVDERERVIGAYSDPKIAAAASKDREQRLYKKKELSNRTFSSVELVLELNAPVADDRL